MKYLSIVKGTDYALTLVHYIRHGRKYDRIYCFDEDSDKILTQYNIEHEVKEIIYNIYISKVVYLMRYQREVGDIVCYQDVFVNFSDYDGMLGFMDTFKFEGILVPDREIYWAGVEKGFLPICKCMFAYNVPENAETDYLSKVTTCEDSEYQDFTYSYYNASWSGWYSRNLNGFADDEVTLQLSKDYDWYCKWYGVFWTIKGFFDPSYLKAGHDLLHMNQFANNMILKIDDDLFEQYEVKGNDALSYMAYDVIYDVPPDLTIQTESRRNDECEKEV